MNQYETGFLISPNLEEEETTKIITQMAGIISKKKGTMIKEDRWGKRKLAYPINKFEEAFYVFFHYEGDPSVPFELERRFKQTEVILRFLTVRKETKENVRKRRKGLPMAEESVAPLDEEMAEEEEAEKFETEEIEKVEKEEGEIAEMVEAEKAEKEEGEKVEKEEVEKTEKEEVDQEDVDSTETVEKDK